MNKTDDGGRKANPRETSNILSTLTFFYTIQTYLKGFKKDLQEYDIYATLGRCKSIKLGDRLEEEWNKELKSEKSSSLIKALLRVFGKEYALYGLIHFVMKTSIGIARPLLVGRLVSFFDIDQTTITVEDAYLFGAGVVLSAVAHNVYYHGYMMMMHELGLRIRIAICSLVYRKSLKLSPGSLQEISNGRIITSVSKDAYSFDGALMFAHDLWIGFVQVPITCFFMYREVGWAGIIAVLFLVVLAPLQVFLAKQIQKARLKSAAKTDERLRLIQEILTSIKIIKMYVWEKFFKEQTDQQRREEIKKLRAILYLRSFLLCIGHLSIRISFYLCVVLYLWFGNKITSRKAFVVIGYYNSLRSIIAICVPYGIAQITEARTAAKRIKTVLTAEELKKDYKSEQSGKGYIKIDNCDVVIGNKTVLEKINLSLTEGFVGVTGTIGSGKSSLLKLILQDIDIAKGTVRVSGKVSYASQEPWLFPSTIRQNILFGEPYNEQRYNTIVDICALKTDFELFPDGDSTVVIDKGLNLSKGQQARVNLARAVYREADVYLLDDSLTALDAHVSKHIFTNCIRGFLKDKLVILVTHSKQFLKEADKIVVLDNGTVQNIATADDVDNIDTGIDGYEEDKEETYKEVCKVKKIEDDEEVQETKETDALVIPAKERKHGIYHEEKQEGKVSWDIYKLYLKSCGGWSSVFFIIILFTSAQFFSSWFDYCISQWVNMEQNMTVLENNNQSDSIEYITIKEKNDFMLTMYTILIFLVALLTIGSQFLLFFYTTRASVLIHKKTFGKVIEATMNFFDLHLSGNILNRFSRDTAAIDEILPYTVLSCIRTTFMLGGVLTIVSTASPYFIGLTIFFGSLLYLLKCIHMPTARSLKRLDNGTRSPVVGHINASIEGIITIRASNAEELLKIQFDDHQDLHCSASYMYLTVSRAFGYFLELINAFFAATVIFMFILFYQNTPSGTVGLAITQVFSLTGILEWGLRMMAELENTMTSVERVVEYSAVEKEDKKEGEIPSNWPTEGKVAFKDVSLTYGKSSEPVLKGISFDVLPKQRIGIIGRTGAGKSSIISTIFRLYPIEGSIIVDGVDITKVNISYLRKKISIIPQDPILFSGTLRSNLDPNHEHTDEQIWNTLAEVDLKRLVDNLDIPINEGGTNFSTGQRQLLCLGRAILKNNKILVLDEATANVDPETDIFIQNTIKTKFNNCTILTIAHRLDTVMNSDKVMVMDKGRIAEFGTPEELLSNENGTFYGMVKQAGLLPSKDKEKNKDL